ncbi:hypothetical protein ACFC0D_37990 [Streptomyces sp. NPDC056222]|uniref:hypothetical protein n=1 Tax=Streptomyces sp. NPDC056222 TaxID=3345749 RepID=UPI0035E27698
MDLYVEVDVDNPSSRIVEDWFNGALSTLFSALTEWESSGSGAVTSIASICRADGAETERFTSDRGGWRHLLDELTPIPYSASLVYFSGEVEIGRVKASQISSGTDHVTLSIGLHCGDEALASAEYCAWISESLRDVMKSMNPGFGRVEYGSFSNRTNLDIGLRRKHKDSVVEARDVLRGYAWVTLCPSELAERLGGAGSLSQSGAFHGVYELDSGGVLLQASETVAGYTDDVMDGVFRTLAPVLPPGVPRKSAAHPANRLVAKDASVASRDSP